MQMESNREGKRNYLRAAHELVGPSVLARERLLGL